MILLITLVLLLLDCKFNCHKRCAYKVPNDCLGETLGNECERNIVDMMDINTFGIFALCVASANMLLLFVTSLCLYVTFFFTSFLSVFLSDILSPSTDTEVPMDYSNEYSDTDKSSMMDDSDEACSIPGSFSPDSGQDGASGDQR